MSFHGNICWSELHVRDMEAAKAFYSKIAGWTFEAVPLVGTDGEYVKAIKDGVPIAGFLDMNLMPHLAEVPAHWLTYVAVADVDASVAALEAVSGSLKRPVFVIPEVGKVALVTDATGATLALMTPLPPAA